MSLPQLLLLAVAAMAGLAILRVVRVQVGRSPLPEGRGRRLFFVGFLVLPPVVVGALVNPATGILGQLRWVPLYLLVLGAIAILMGVVALVVRLVAPGRSRPLLMLALVGSQPDPYDPPFDPPVTAKLAESVALVDRANAVFPRGREFPTQINLDGFRFAWDALDAATGTLEGQIDDDHRLGLAVASDAEATATDARSRLDTLRRLAADHGQAWAGT